MKLHVFQGLKFNFDNVFTKLKTVLRLDALNGFYYLN